MRYLDPEYLRHLIENRQDPETAEELGKALILLAQQVVYYIHPIDPEEAVGKVVYQLWRVLDKYEPNRGSPFAYLTTTAIHAARGHRIDHKREERRIQRYAQQKGLL